MLSVILNQRVHNQYNGCALNRKQVAATAYLQLTSVIAVGLMVMGKACFTVSRALRTIERFRRIAAASNTKNLSG